MTNVGDVVELAGRKQGDTATRGTVVAVRGAMLSIRWDSGRESVMVPSAGNLAVVSEAKAAKVKATKTKATKAKPAKTKATKATPAKAKATKKKVR